MIEGPLSTKQTWATKYVGMENVAPESMRGKHESISIIIIDYDRLIDVT